MSNRFALVLIAAKRTKELMKDDEPLISNDRENKEIVTSLREIAAGCVSADHSKFYENVAKMHLEIKKNNTEANYSIPPEAQ
jgi:DNA-directed RNA polymerase omega subunit